MGLLKFYQSLSSTSSTPSDDGYTGQLSGVVIRGNFTYSSSIDSINNLYASYAYDSGIANMAIFVLIHDYTGNADSFTEDTFSRFAEHGVFVISVGMRGRNSADGARDLSARELYDIVDGIDAVKSRFSTLVNPNRVIANGYSAGGGNALGLACKFPDTFNLLIDNFGISDYGFDGTTSWYFTNPTQQAGLDTDIGGSRATHLNEYKSRDTRSAIGNFGLLNTLRIFHDTEDDKVDVINSQAINSVVSGSSKFDYNETTIGDLERWTHQYPFTGSDIIESEPLWTGLIYTASKTFIPSTGSITVIGYIVTSRFTIWLGNGTDAEDGMNRTATVDYNVLTDTYVVTPLLETGATDCVVKITQGSKSVTATISSTTLLVVV